MLDVHTDDDEVDEDLDDAGDFWAARLCEPHATRTSNRNTTGKSLLLIAVPLDLYPVKSSV